MRSLPPMSALALGAAAVALLGGGAAAQTPLVPQAAVHQHRLAVPVAPPPAAPILSGVSAMSAPIPGSAATSGLLVPRTGLSVSPAGDFSSALMPPVVSPLSALRGVFSASASTGWTFAGPDGILNDTGAVDAVGETASGRVAAIAADPTDATDNTFYVGAAGGGVWKTTNGGASYIPLTDFLGDTATGSIAVAPSDHSTLYVGTGEANFSGDSKYGIGLLKSTDGGATWSVIPGPGGVFNRRSISKVVVDPTSASTVYLTITYSANGFTGSSGVWKSVDGGQTWANTTALVGLDQTNPYTDLVIDPIHPQTLYTAVGYIFGAGTNGVYKTTNGGTTWTLLSGLPASGSSTGRISLALAASAPQTLYASVAQTIGAGAGLFGLYKTTDGGATWAQMTAAPNYLGGQGWYDDAVVVSPTDPNTVFVGGVVNYSGTYGSLFALAGSHDGGVTFQDFSIGQGTQGPHTDLHALTFTADGTKMLDGNDGGIWRLENPYSNPGSGGTVSLTTVNWTDLNTNLDTVQFTGIALHPTDPKTAYGGSQDNGTEKTTGTLPWTAVRGGDGGFVRVDQSNPLTVYHEYYGISLERSDDGGVTWRGRTSGINKSDPQPADGEDPAAFYVPYKLDPANQSRVIYGTDHVYESVNKGNNFTTIGTPGVNGFNPGDAVINTLGVAGPTASSPGAIYVAAGGHLYATFNDGSAWTDVSIPGITPSFSDIYVNPLDTADVIAAVGSFGGGKVYRSTNGGQAWASISTGLPDEPFNAVLADKVAGVLYAGGDDGVYSSTNFGGSWTKLSTGLPTVQVVDLALTNATGILAAGTHGRGMWTLPLSTILAKPNVAFGTAFARVGGVLQLTVTLRNAGTANTPVGVGAADAFNPVMTRVTLNGVAGVPGTGTVAVIPAYGQATPLTYTFPGAAAGAGVLQIAGTYTGGSFGGTIRVTAP